jgi:hypothetical protein
MISALIHLVVYLVILGVVVWLMLYLVQTLPMAEPFGRIARVAITVVGVLLAILLLLRFAGVIDPGALG